MYQEYCAYISKEKCIIVRSDITQFFAHSEEESDLQSTGAKFEFRSDH